MKDLKVIEFEPQYAEEARELARLAMEGVGIAPDVIDLYVDEDFDYGTISEVYKGRSRFWVALEGGRVVGSIAITEIDQTTARLRRMFVLPEAQGKGVGQELFSAALEFVKSNGYTKVVLDTDKLMHKAHKFYEKNGFVKMREDETRMFYERSLG